jgi:uncharacterized protein YqjF (DUF2071 family)
MTPARFADVSLERPDTRWCDVVTQLRHFAIVTYTVDPEKLRPLIHPRFELDCIIDSQGRQRALMSIVPFEDRDFHFVGAPWARFGFGQTNYRVYVTDRETGQRVVWFFGTTLGSWTVGVPRHLWKLPWHAGRFRFDCEWDAGARRYQRYALRTQSDWAPLEMELADTGEPVRSLEGFDDLEHGLFILTHPLTGFFHRRDGRLGSYRVWHDRLQCTSGRMVSARIGLFERLGLVSPQEQQHPHSVLIQPETEFTILLPPRRAS